MLTERNCNHCGAAFRQNVGNQIYCSAVCRREATWPTVSRPRPLQVCMECEESFVPDSGHQKRCRACISANRVPPGARPDPGWRHAVCLACHCEFEKGAPGQRYCSEGCKRAAKRRASKRCAKCGEGFSPVANQQYCPGCKPTPYERMKMKRVYDGFKGDVCERCLFKAEHSCQLDVHHRDGNFRNNDPANLETLCANCHRLEGVA